MRSRLIAAVALPALGLLVTLSATNSLSPITGGAAVAVVAVAGALVWSTIRPLERLADAADVLSEERVPQLVEALSNPGEADETYLAATIEPLALTGASEMRRLARAYNDLQSVAVTVAARQADLLRKGITDLYVNLARRNQALLERQIKLLDRLEASEQDPDVLENLYQIDHLSTRMRRNAESLLVLANADSSRRSRPIGVSDVVRSALSEVEQYDRVELDSMVPATIHGPAVSDIAHILAELIENAAQFSPPNRPVTVEGTRTGGSYQIVITDEGVGLPEDQMGSLNDILRDPPVIGLALGHSLGCLVAARLAARHGITVRLRPGRTRGVAAYVILPRHLISEDTVVAPQRSVTDGGADGGRADPVEAPVTRPENRPERLADALPAATSFAAGLESLLESAIPETPSSHRDGWWSHEEADAVVDQLLAGPVDHADPQASAPVDAMPSAEPLPRPGALEAIEPTVVGFPVPRPPAPSEPVDAVGEVPQAAARVAVDAGPEVPRPAAPSEPVDAVGEVPQAAARVAVDAAEGMAAAAPRYQPTGERAEWPWSTDRDTRPVEERPTDTPPPLARRVRGASLTEESGRSIHAGVRRSPDEVRSMLSKYRSGLSAGRTSEPTPTTSVDGNTPYVRESVHRRGFGSQEDVMT